MKVQSSIALLALVLATASARAEDKKYSMADLKSLVDDKSYQEALVHMGDIAPSERKAEWKDLLGIAAAGFASSGKDAIDKLRNMLAIEEQYPAVVKHAKYAAVRTEWGPKGFDSCFQQSYDVSECRSFAIKFVDDDASNGKLALAMAKVARKGMNAYNSTPLFKRAVAASKKTACKDKDLELSAVAALGLPTDYDDYADGKTVIDSCFAELKPSIVKELEKGETGYFKDNACALLTSKGDKATVAKLCSKNKDD